MSNKNQNGPAMIKKITLIMLSIIFLHMNTYAYIITTKNNNPNLGGKCEKSINYQDRHFITSDGETLSKIELNDCSPTATNKICRIAYFKSDNGTCTFPFDHQKQTLSAAKNPSCSGEVYAFWAKSLDNTLYKINYPNGIIDYFDCNDGTYTTRSSLANTDCTKGETFSHYSIHISYYNHFSEAILLQTTVGANEQIQYNTYLQAQFYNLLLTPKKTACPKGYYCEAGNCFENKKPCPAGHTTDGTGADDESDCKITTGTEFCDINGCFTLNDL